MTLTASAPAQASPQLPQYTWGDLLYQGPKTAVYRAVDKDSQQPVVIKYLRQGDPHFGELVQFRNQYTITKNLSISGVVKSLGLEPFGNRYALIMEDTGGISLEQFAQQHPLTLTDVLNIGIQLAEILHQLYQHRIIHKDIKPANILIHPDSRQVKLIDFSISSQLPKETRGIQSAGSLEGTLAYMAPEQTGRMNRTIDYRTDFYALGVMLYQLLTGQLPFTSDDPLELIHCHIAQPPVAVDQVNPAVPPVVAAIVAKLMAKNAEDRYQSALGLKHDLAQCLPQRKAPEKIVDFELGQRDLGDRFLIPEKLYGRKAEVKMLLDAFDRVAQGTSELLLVAGFSGIGKTAVVNEVHKPIVQRRGYFIKGKFDQFNRNIPFSAFVQALRDLIGQLLSESDTELQIWKTQILDALGENAQVIIDLIPELENITGSQPPAPELSGNAAQNRFNLLFQRFIQLFTTAEHPLVIFIDDLQWADSASLNLIQLLMTESQAGHLLLLGAYRDNEVFPAHPLMLSLDELQKSQASIDTIILQPLSAESLNHFIAETFRSTTTVVEPLTELVIQKTQGNPFFATQFLKTLHQDQLISFDRDAGHWQCNLVNVRAAALTDDVVKLMAQRLQKLPDATQEMLKLAACIGAQFDLETLSIVSEQSLADTATVLWQALQEGAILPESDIYKFYLGEQQSSAAQGSQMAMSYRFLHDRVQQAAYSLIPDEQKQVFHLSIGRHLLSHSSAAQIEDKLFDIVSQLNMGLSLITDSGEKETLLQLNVRAGQKAIAATAYDTAVHCLKVARDLLAPNSWDIWYDLTLDCYTSATEAAYLNGALDEMESLAEYVIHQSKTVVDAAKVHEIKIEAYTSQAAFKAALTTGLDFLKSLGMDFPSEPSDKDFESFLVETQQQLPERSTDALIALPEMTSPTHQAMLKVLVQIAAPAYIARPALYPLICLKQVQLSIQYGHIPASAFGYAVYGLLLTGIIGDIKAGYEFGQLALKLLEKFNSQEYTAKILLHNCHFTEHWQAHARLTLHPLQEAYTAGLNTGDFAYVGYSAFVYIFHSYCVGKELMELERECQIYSASLESIQQKTTLCYLQIIHQAVANLLGQSDSPRHLVGEILDEQITVDSLEQLNDEAGLWHLYACKVSLNYLFCDYSETIACFHQAMSHRNAGIGMLNIPILWFYAALACLAQLAEKPVELESEQADKLWSLVTEAKAKLSGWAAHAPMNCQHRYDLVCAEEQRVLGHPQQAIEEYNRAISGAKENSYLQEEALANELAANFYLKWGREQAAASYLQAAYHGYSRWGAQAKVADLDERYPDLRRPMLSASAPMATSAINEVNRLEEAASQLTRSSAHENASRSTLSQSIDVASLLKTAQILSSEIEMDSLLATLLHTVIENAGADKGVLLMPHGENQWFVEAVATLNTATQICSSALSSFSEVPKTLIHRVKHSGESLVIDDASASLMLATDAYVTRYQPKSLLCTPIAQQGKLTAILYLENRFVTGAFTRDRVEIINLLASQAAISLENARLYQQVETYSHTLEAEVDRKTQALNQKNQDLEHALKELKQTQAQLIQTEKMFSLGQMVAGVAHEINNPVSFIKGNIQPLESYFKDLQDLLSLYEEEHLCSHPSIQEKQTEIDLDFLFEDVEAILGSMSAGSDRIQKIVLSLRNFSRLDESAYKAVNIHSGIDSTLSLVQHRLKASTQTPDIKILCDYGHLPLITCYPSQLNQVFLNIINNAIDAIRDNPDCSEQPEIRINTEALDGERVRIAIANTDSTIPKDIQKQIFDPFFTTKPVGDGSGLGLFACYSIVQNHGGTITASSAPGEGTLFELILPYRCT